MDPGDGIYILVCMFACLLAPTGALIVVMVYYISAQRQLFQIFTQSLDAIDVTSVTPSPLNSINAIDVTSYLGEIFGISLRYLWDIFKISLGYLQDILGIFWGYVEDMLGISLGYFGDILGIS